MKHKIKVKKLTKKHKSTLIKSQKSELKDILNDIFNHLSELEARIKNLEKIK